MDRLVEGQEPTGAQPDQVRVREVMVGEQLRDVARELVERVRRAGGIRAPPVAPQVGSENMELLREAGEDLVPNGMGASETVQ